MEAQPIDRKNDMLRLRVPRPLADDVRRYAAEAGVTISEVVRGAVLRQFRPTPSDQEVNE